MNETIKQKRSRSLEMRYHWLTERDRKQYVDVYCRPVRDNIGDSHTKHDSAQIHKDMRPVILHHAKSVNALEGRVKLPQSQPHTRIYI
jgi:hypothetical protein